MKTAKVDDKLRVRIPDAKPGQVVLVKKAPNGWTLTLEEEPRPTAQRTWTKAEVLKAIDKSPCPFNASWDELKKDLR